MKLVAYAIGGGVEIVAASPERAWMDAARERAPYRCLPLAIANTHGWELRNPVGFSAMWGGTPGIDDIVVMPDGEGCIARSHFGEGVLTFTVPFIFRTPPEMDLIVQGPINRPKDAISALTGVVESDWIPYTFTMNWKFTRARTAVRFGAGEPFCHIFPVRRGDVEAMQPEIRPLADDPDLDRRYREWSASRDRFQADLAVPGSAAAKAGWQKHYQHGRDLDGPASPPSHRTRGRPRPFRKPG